jgi:hypothetical protein
VVSTLVADTDHLYFPTFSSGYVEALALGSPCLLDGGAGSGCVTQVSIGGWGCNDPIVLGGGSLFWVQSDGFVARSDLGAFFDAGMVDYVHYPTVVDGPITGFAAGSANVYFGEADSNGAGLVDRASSTVPQTGVMQVTAIARHRLPPTSFALDGKNVYWATDDCDIEYIADSPQ